MPTCTKDKVAVATYWETNIYLSFLGFQTKRISDPSMHFAKHKQLDFITETVTAKNESIGGMKERKVLVGGWKTEKIPARENVCKKIHAKKTSGLMHGVGDDS